MAMAKAANRKNPKNHAVQAFGQENSDNVESSRVIRMLRYLKNL